VVVNPAVVDDVLRTPPKLSDRLTILHVAHDVVLVDVDGKSIKLDVTVRTEAQHVRLDIRTVMRPTDALGVRCLAVEAGGQHELLPAELAAVVVTRFDVLGNVGNAD
jgi:hypothetical protein